MRFAYADPPYPGMSDFYKNHPDYAGEVDHSVLMGQCEYEFDGAIVHTASTTLAHVLHETPNPHLWRIMAWVKPFAAFKKNVTVAYAWEPVLVKAVRKPEITGRIVSRDWIAEPMTMQRGLVGAKPEAVCMWLFEVAGLSPDDEFVDLFPGSGAVTRAWEKWRSQMRLAL